MHRWDDINARARGLATHLLGPPRLAALANSVDLDALAAGLGASGFPVVDGEASAGAIELSVRRVAAQRLRLLAWWCGRRAAILAVVFEDEERRSLRALLRGAVAAAPPAQRLAGLIPTPALPERALEELARQATVAALATLLVAWRHPYGDVLLPLSRAAQPDLLRIELALSTTWAARALHAARRAGRHGPIERHARELVDLENAFTAMALAGESRDIRTADAFLAGGAVLGAATFEEAIAAGRSGAGRVVAHAFGSNPLGVALGGRAGNDTDCEAAVLEAQIARCLAERRLDPLSPIGVLEYTLRLRAEVLHLRRIIWGIALAVPRQSLVAGLPHA